MASAPEYKDLDRMRLEWFITETNIPVDHIAWLMKRKPRSIYQQLYRMGLSVGANRHGREAKWCAR